MRAGEEASVLSMPSALTPAFCRVIPLMITGHWCYRVRATKYVRQGSCVPELVAGRVGV